MRIKVEQHRMVVWFIRHQASEAERYGYYEQLARLRKDAVALIENSEPVHDPIASRYMLRFFRFKNCIAIFETNRARDRISVRVCQRLREKPRESEAPADGA